MRRIFKPSLRLSSLARLTHWPESPRRRLIAAVVGVLIVIVAVVAITDPFAANAPSSNGVSDNAYPTSIQTITRQSLTQQTQVSATLGYAGSTTIAIPSGTPASAITQASTTALAADQKVSADKGALSNAASLGKYQGNSTLTAAEATVSNDESTLNSAKRQLSADEQLGCPPSSSATVSSGSSSPSSGSPSSGSPSSSTPTTTSPSSGGGTGNTGAHDLSKVNEAVGLEPAVTGAPIVTTGASSGVTSTDATLSGTVNPNGLSTSYEFEYGTTTTYGSTTPSVEAGSASAASSVSASISDLKPGTTYDFVLVATNAAGTSVGTAGSFQTTSSSCAAERLVIATDTQAVTEAKDALAADRINDGSSVTSAEQQLSNDEASATSANQALSTAEAQATNPAATFTSLPSSGTVLRRGDSVYSLDGHPVPLFYGTATPYRALYLGVTDGPDVTELQTNLIALGFGGGISASPHFSSATEAAVKSWQASIGVPQTGIVALGDIVIQPGPIEVDTVTANAGQAVQSGGAVLSATSTTPEVTVDLDAAQQSQVKVGDQVIITLPDNSTTPGVVSSVGKIATSPSSGGNGNTPGSSSPTITVEVTPLNPKATGGLDQAPVEVSITTASVSNVLVAPVDALVALAGGGYALEEIDAGGVHHLVPVSVGLFDDAAGLVQVSGAGLAVGQRVVVPNT